MSELITIVYTCGHKSLPRPRFSTGSSDSSPFVCECKSCWPEDTKDLNTISDSSSRSEWCPDCRRKWREKNGAVIEIIQTHSCGHRWVRYRDPLHFDPSEDGKYYSSHPFLCPDCDKNKHSIWNTALKHDVGKRYFE